MLAATVAQHFQVDDQALVDADRVDLDGLQPVGRVLWARGDHNLGGKANHVADSELIAFRCLQHRSIAFAR